MDILIALGTVLVVTIIFYKFLNYVSNEKHINRIEPNLVEKYNHLKLKSSQKKEVIKKSNYYYTFLFAMAAFIAFYITSLILAILLSTIVFAIGFMLGFILLKKYGKKIT